VLQVFSLNQLKSIKMNIFQVLLTTFDVIWVNLTLMSKLNKTQYSFNKKLQSQILTRVKLRKTLSYKKGVHKILMKLSPSVVVKTSVDIWPFSTTYRRSVI